MVQPGVMPKGIHQPIVILVRPQMAENIGAVARAMGNFGLTKLRIIAPKCNPTADEAIAMSAGNCQVLFDAQTYNTLPQATSDVSYVLGSADKPRDHNMIYQTPDNAFVNLPTKNFAIVFGPERTGLTNADLVYVNAIITIPTNAIFSSLNLAQAAVVILSAWFNTSPANKNLETKIQTIASQGELNSFLCFFEEKLEEANFWQVPEKKVKMIQNIRAAFQRMQPSEQEVRTMYGAIKALVRKSSA